MRVKASAGRGRSLTEHCHKLTLMATSGLEDEFLHRLLAMLIDDTLGDVHHGMMRLLTTLRQWEGVAAVKAPRKRNTS